MAKWTLIGYSGYDGSSRLSARIEHALGRLLPLPTTHSQVASSQTTLHVPRGSFVKLALAPETPLVMPFHARRNGAAPDLGLATLLLPSVAWIAPSSNELCFCYDMSLLGSSTQRLAYRFQPKSWARNCSTIRLHHLAHSTVVLRTLP